MTEDYKHTRAALARAGRRGLPPDHPERIALRQKMRGQRLHAIVKEKIADWGPISDEQLAKIAALLLSARTDVHDGAA